MKKIWIWAAILGLVAAFAGNAMACSAHGGGEGGGEDESSEGEIEEL